MERELGQLSISINTSIPIETMKTERYRPKIDYVYINLETIVRNFFASMTAVDQASLDLSVAVQMLMDELRIIHTQLNTAHIFFYQEPKEIRFMFPYATFKTPRTEKQMTAAARHKVVMQHLLYELSVNKDNATPGRYNGPVPLLLIDRKLPPRMEAVAVLTHYPHQLLKRFDFTQLYLLESRTGRVKSFDQFATKLNGVKEGDPIPFNYFTLQIFGDTGLFASAPAKIKKELKLLGEHRKWTSITSNEKFSSDLLGYASPELKTYCTTISMVRI